MYTINNQSSTGKMWKILGVDDLYIKKLDQLFSIDANVAKILSNRKIPFEQVASFVNPKLKHSMPDPSLLNDMDKFCESIVSSLQKGEKILIIGDYDVDGITSTAIFFEYLRKLQCKVNTYIPNRYKEGYGISMAVLENISFDSFDTLILLDNGSTAKSELELISKHGKKALIIDHHSVDETQIPNCDAFINPKRFDDNSGLEYLCTAGLVFLTIIALNKILRANNYLNESGISLEDPLQYLDMVALATVADIVPLVGVNRAYVVQGLKLLNRRINVGLSALIDVLNIEKCLDYSDLGFAIGPCINAASRMGNHQLALDMLLMRDKQTAKQLALQLVSFNKLRQQEEQQMIQSAILEAESQLKEGNDQHIILLGLAKWSKGIIGIAASRIKEIYGKPTCLFSIDTDTNIATMSGRSVDGVDLGNIISGAKQRGLLIKGGGHYYAVGCSFHMNKLSELESFFNKEVARMLKNKPINQHIIVDDVLPLYSVNDDFVQKLKTLEPFGSNFETPLFVLSNTKIANVQVIGQHKNHLAVTLTDGLNYKVKGFCYKCLPGILGEAIVEKEGGFCFCMLKSITDGCKFKHMMLVDEGILIDKLKYGETSLIITVFSYIHGIQKMLIKGALSSKYRGVFEIGNVVNFEKRSRDPISLGSATVHLQKTFLSEVFNDKLKLYILCCVAKMVNEFIVPNYQYQKTYEDTLYVMHKLKTHDYLLEYAKWEVRLLSAIGIGLDMSQCTISENKDVFYLSPKTGRAVTKTIGDPYKDKLFIIPKILLDHQLVDIKNLVYEIKQSLEITEYFFGKFAAEYGRKTPFIRENLLTELG